MPSVTIGPEFFKKEFLDYANWRWAWVREIMQNSIDCGSNAVAFEVSEQNGKTHVIVTNNGEPMTEEILVNKLLALGASAKNFGGAVGGFGKAKNILLFCHDSWDVVSGTTHVFGVGGEYSIETLNNFNGTRTSVIMDGELQDDLLEQVEKFARYAQWDGVLTFNGRELVCDQQKGSRRRDLGFGVVYTNKSDSYRLVVRIGGIPMFTQYCGHDRLVIVELTGESKDVLTSNRDGLVSPFSGELSNFVTELTVDKRSALKPSVPRYERFAGVKLGHSKKRESSNVRALVEIPRELGVALEEAGVSAGESPDFSEAGSADEHWANVGDSPVGSVSIPSSTVRLKAAAYVAAEVSEHPKVVTLGEEFVIKNETDLIIPNYYRPDSGEFSSYSKKLVRIWGRLLVELHRMFDHEAEFAVGFIFDADIAAEYESNSPYGPVYYLNPAKVVEQVYTYSKSFKKRWSFDNSGKKMMLAVAAHEFVHGLGYDWHSEDFACKYTDVVGYVLAAVKRFNWCYK